MQSRTLLKLIATLSALAAVATAYQNCAQTLPSNVDAASMIAAGSGLTPHLSGTSCKQIKDGGFSKGSGKYWLDVDLLGPLAPFEAYCDMDTDGGGWTLVARNDSTTTFVIFDKTWNEYRDGFGNLSTAAGVGWLGNERLHRLTVNGVNLLVKTDVRPHLYAGFQVDTEAGKYAMRVVSTPASNDGDSFAANHSGVPFTANDRDNDANGTINCAVTFQTGWWHKGCYAMSIAGNNTGRVYWRDPTGAVEPVNWIEMWIR